MPASTHLIPALKANAQTGTTQQLYADFIRQLKYGVEDAHFILMVAQLPQLEKLLIDGLTPYPKPASLLLSIKRVLTFVKDF
jgi:hypothetical protein